MFFTSTQQLTDNASQGETGTGGIAGKRCHVAGASGCNLYESVCADPCGKPGEEPNGAGRQLIDLSEAEDKEPVAGGPRVQGVMAISPDGSHVYFVARGVLTKHPNAEGQEANRRREQPLRLHHWPAATLHRNPSRSRRTGIQPRESL